MKWSYLHIICCLFPFLLGAQTPFVSLEVSKTKLEVGEQFEVKIKTNVDGDLELNFPDEFQRSGPVNSGMSSSVTYSSGKGEVNRFSFQTFAGFIDTEGSFSLGPVKVTNDKEEVVSETVKIQVRKEVNMISADPGQNMNQAIFGIIKLTKKELYEGEPLLLEAKVYAQVDVMQVDHFSPFQFRGSHEQFDLEQSTSIARNIEVINGREVMTFKLGKSLFFPDQIGTFEVSPFQMVLLYNDPRRLFPEHVKIKSNEEIVRVKPLPDGAPFSFIGGVGEFSSSIKFVEKNIKQGKVFPFVVKVKGKGNIHNIDVPKIKLPDGVTQYGEVEINEDIEFSAEGAEGTKEFTFYLQSEVHGKVNFEGVEIAYFSPVTETYQTAKSAGVTVDFEQTRDFIPVNETEVKEAAEIEESLIVSDFETSLSKDINRKNYIENAVLIWISSPVLLGILFGLIFKIKSGNTSFVSNKKRTDDKTFLISQLEQFMNDSNCKAAFEDGYNQFNLYFKKYYLNNSDDLSAYMNLFRDKGISKKLVTDFKQLFVMQENNKYSFEKQEVNNNAYLNVLLQIVDKID